MTSTDGAGIPYTLIGDFITKPITENDLIDYSKCDDKTMFTAPQDGIYSFTDGEIKLVYTMEKGDSIVKCPIPELPIK